MQSICHIQLIISYLLFCYYHWGALNIYFFFFIRHYLYLNVQFTHISHLPLMLYSHADCFMCPGLLRFLLSILCDAHKHEKWQKLSSSSLSLNKHCHRWTVFIATYFKQNKDSPYENLFCQQIVSRHDFIFIHWFPTDFKCTIISIVSSNATWWSKTLPLNVIVLRWIISSKMFQQILRISMVCFWQKNYWHLDLRFSRWQLDSHIAVQPHTHILAEWVCEH